MEYMYKITRYLMIISITFLVFCLCYLKNIEIKEVFGEENNYYNLSVEEENIYFFDDSIVDIITDQDYTVYSGINESYLVKDQIILKINDCITKLLVNENIYLLSRNKIYMYDFKTLKEESYDEIYYEDFLIYKNNLYVCGEDSGDAYFGEYSLDLNLMYETSLGGLQNEIFKNIHLTEEYIYLTGEKDSVSEQGPFKNCGLNDTITPFIVLFDKSLELLKEVHFNNVDESEYLKQVLFKDHIYILLNTNDLICLDYNLELIPIFKNTNKIDLLMMSIHNELLLFNYDNNTLFLEDQLFYQANSKILKIGLKSGNLMIYLQEYSNEVKELQMFEYHVEKNELLVCSKYNYDLTSLDNLKVTSYFEKLEKEIKEYSPYFQKNIDGEYDIKYLITRSNNKTFTLDGKLIVKHYVNIINDGIYKPNKELNFYGEAILNNEKIHNGYIVSKPGDYELILTNANNEKRTYNFKIINNYYLENELVTFDSDYQVNQNKDLDVKININSNKEFKIKEVIVNNEHYSNYKLIDNTVHIYFMGKAFYSIDVYKINKIVLDNNIEIPINKVITVKTLKELPLITLNQTSRLGKINLDYKLNDPSKAILYLKIDYILNNQIITTYYNYFNGDTVTFDTPNESTNIRYTLVMHDGNKTFEQVICEYKVKVKDLNKIHDLQYIVDLNLSNIKIDLDTTNAKYEYLTVNEKNLLSNIEIISAIINYKTIIIICIPIIILTALYILVRKKLKKKKLY